MAERCLVRCTSFLSVSLSAAAAGLTLSCVSAVAVRAQSPAFPTNATLDSLIAKQMAAAGIMGLGAALIVKGHVVWMKGYGFADRQDSRGQHR